MNRTVTLLMAVVLVVGGVSAFPMAAAAQSGPSTASAVGGPAYEQVAENASENAANVTPGERLSAVVGVGHAEFEGELEQRTYGIEYAGAATADAKAAVVQERLTAIEQRLAELEQERGELEEARENGSIDEGEYQARATELSARTESVEQLADASEARAGELPADVLAANGVNVTAIQLLKTQAEELTGPQVAAIAQSIAGPDAGRAISQGPPEDIGGPADGEAGPGDRGDGADGDAQAAIDRAEEQLDATEQRLVEVEQRVNETDAGENATEAIAQAREELEQARTALADARAAFDAGDEDAAATHVEDALTHAEQAEAHAEDALEAANDAGDDGGDGQSGSSTGTSADG